MLYLLVQAKIAQMSVRLTIDVYMAAYLPQLYALHNPPPLISPIYMGERGGHYISCSDATTFRCNIHESTLHHLSYILASNSKLGLNNHKLLYKWHFYEIFEDILKLNEFPWNSLFFWFFQLKTSLSYRHSKIIGANRPPPLNERVNGCFVWAP